MVSSLPVPALTVSLPEKLFMRKTQRVGEIVDVEELAEGGCRRPAGDGRRAAFLGLMETADRGRKHVGVLGVVVVVGAVEVGGHHGDEVGAVLAVEELAVFEARDLRKGVGLVGLLELGGEQARFLHGPGRHAGMQILQAEELKLAAALRQAALMTFISSIMLSYMKSARADELATIPPTLAAARKTYSGRSAAKKSLTACPVDEHPPRWVRVMMGAASPALQFAYDGRADHAAVTGDVDSGVFSIISRFLSRGIRPGWCGRALPARSTATLAMSASTMRLTSCSECCLSGGIGRRRSRALVGSPQRLTTSVGR